MVVSQQANKDIKSLNFPTLASERLVLNQLNEADKDAVFNLFSSPEVIEYYDLDAFKDAEQALDLINFFNRRFIEKSGIRWAIRLKNSNELIGTCGFNSWNSKMQNAVIGYDLLPTYWQQGYSTEAVKLIVKAAFDGGLPCDSIHRIQADTVTENIASEALLTKLGFEFEGIRRQSGFWKGQFHDLKCFGLLKPEFQGS